METLYEVYTEYINYLTRTGEEITFEEWKLHEKRTRYREFEPAIKKYIKYGIVALIGLGVLSKLTTGIYQTYRRNTDECIKKCGGSGFIKAKGMVTAKCYNTCYMQAAGAVITRIKQDLSNLSRIKNSEDRREVEKKLKKELQKWQERYDKYKLRAQTAPTVIVGPKGAAAYKKRGGRR